MLADRRFTPASGRQTRVFALTIVVCALLVATSSRAAVAAQPPPAPALAQDGRGLLTEPFATRATFTAVWGDRAPAEWVQEHDAALSAGKPASGPRIGYLSSAGPFSNPIANQSFVAGLRDAGYSPGQNISIEWHFAEGRTDQLPSLAADLVREPVDVIVANVTPDSLAAKQATTTIPIVALALADPVGVGLVDSLDRPGGNVTGMLFQPLDFNGQRLALLKEAVPSATRVAVLVNVANPSYVRPLALTRDAAQSLGLELQVLEVRAAEDLPSAFASMTDQRADALLMQADNLFNLNRPQILQLAAQSRIPTLHAARTFVDDGGLMDYSVLAGSGARRAAGYVADILHGANPAELPMGVPSEFELVLNLTAAQDIGYTFPATILAKATEIIR